MIIDKLEVTDFYGTLDNSGNSVFTKIYALYFTGDWNPTVIGLSDITVDDVTLPGVGSTMGDDIVSATYYASAIAPRIENRQAGFASVTVQFKNSETFEMLAGARDTVAWEDGQQQREVCFDFDGKAIVNTAKQPFAQNAPVAFALRGCTITGIRTTKKLPPISKWKVVNASPVTIDGVNVAAGQAWITGCRCETTYVQGAKRYLHNWTLAFSETHDLEVPNFGTVELDNGKPSPIVRNGIKVQQPWPLDENGVAFSANYQVANIVKLTFKVTQSYDFGSFGWKF